MEVSVCSQVVAKERPEWLTKSTVYDPDAPTLDAAMGDDDLTTEPRQTRHHRKDDTGTVSNTGHPANQSALTRIAQECQK